MTRLVRRDAQPLLVGVRDRDGRDRALRSSSPAADRRCSSASPPRRSAQTSASSKRCSIITGRVARRRRREVVARPSRRRGSGSCALRGEEVVDERSPFVAAGQVEVDRAIEPPGSKQRRIEIGRPVGGRDDEHVGRASSSACGCARSDGSNAVHALDEPSLDAHAGRRLVERLQLDQQLVDDAGDAFASGRRPMPERVEPMASISSMKPMAPPSRRAAVRNARKYERILRLVWP